MRPLTEEEYQNLESVPRKGSAVYEAIMALKVGECYLVEKEDWTQQNSFTTWLKRHMRQNPALKFESKRLKDGGGWKVKRVG